MINVEDKEIQEILDEIERVHGTDARESAENYIKEVLKEYYKNE